MQTISHKPTCALSQFSHCLIRRNVRVIDSWDRCYQFLLMEWVRRHLSLVTKTQYCTVVVSRGGWHQVTVSLLPPIQPARLAGDWAWMSFDLLCNATCVNSCRIFSDAHNIGRYNRIRYDSIYDKCKKLKSLKECLTATQPTSHN